MLLVSWTFVAPWSARAADATAEGAPAPAVLQAMVTELGRAMDGLRSTDGIRPYYVAYEVQEQRETRLSASWGAMTQEQHSHVRALDVDLRVGDYELDSSHEVRGDTGPLGSGASFLPIEDEPLALRQVIWGSTDDSFKEALERISRVKSSLAVKAEREDSSADFSPAEPIVDVGGSPAIEVDRAAWADVLRRASAVFLTSPTVYDANATLDVGVETNYFASSEGTRLVHGGTAVRLMLFAATRADDGMELFLFRGWEGFAMDELPGGDEVVDAARELVDQLDALRKAPIVEPYTGPAILSGRAAAVFFHEIFGHRIEGHRQKSDDEGQTFTKKVGKVVLPDFLTVFDDPTMARFEGTDLMGHYTYDNEGVPSARTTVVAEGVLKGFLMSRSPVAGFARSNGHGRRQAGVRAVGRQGNLVVSAARMLSTADLRARLKDAVTKQGKPFGLYFEDISGGFTFTQREAPQSYKVLPLVVYKVFPDDRPDELVRGVDIVGTPLASFAKIVAAGGDVEVFNGYCGAESGYIPVSAVAPGLLVSEMEIEKRAKGVERPPILAPPPPSEVAR